MGDFLMMEDLSNLHLSPEVYSETELDTAVLIGTECLN